MDIDQFWHNLKTKFNYQSPFRNCLLAKYLPGWATFIYYLKLSKLILTESIAARNGEFNNKRWAQSSLKLIKIIESAGGKFYLSDLKGMQKHRGPFVYIANHMSMLDTFILPSITLAYTNITFVIKEGLLKYPLFGTILKAIEPITVTRQKPREDLKKVIKQGYEFISKGYSIIIFPQTTRSEIFDASSFNTLGVKLAKKTGVPVVPVALKTDFLSNGRIFKEIGFIDPSKTLFLKFGAPIPVEGNGRNTHQKVVEFIAKNLKEWGCEVRNVDF